MPSIIRLRNQKKSKKEPLHLLTREMSEAKLKEVNSSHSGIPWDHILKGLDVDGSFSCFHKQLEKTCENVIPLKMKRISYNRILRDPWLTSSLRNCLNKQKHLYKDTLISDSVEKLNKYRTYRNTLQKLIRYCKSQYYVNKCAEFKNDSRKLWDLINKKISRCNNKTDSIDRIKVDNIHKTDAKLITSSLCKHFAMIGKKYAEKIPKPKVSINEYIQKITGNNKNLFLSPTTEHNVASLITALPNKTSSG